MLMHDNDHVCWDNSLVICNIVTYKVHTDTLVSDLRLYGQFAKTKTVIFSN